MKTFKLVSLQVVDECGLINISIDDGLIINKEDENRNWLLEAYVKDSYEDYFQSLFNAGHVLNLQVIISRKENDPALFQGKLVTIKKLTDHISILFKGTINRSRNDYAERLLTLLIENGVSGTELIKEFKKKMVTKPMLAPAKKTQP